MDQPVSPADIYERAVRRQTGHGAFDHVSNRQAVEKVVPATSPVLVLGRLLTDDQAVPLSIDFQDLDRNALADQLLQVAGVGTCDLARGQEAS